MRCPRCGYLDSKVVDTRTSHDVNMVRRRRVCPSCGRRFSTTETVCAEYPVVIKRDGREEEFECQKIKNGLLKAFKKCPGIEEKVGRIFNNVVGEILSKYPEKVHTEAIGLIVMNMLRAGDPVAYLRFASVYKNFETADDFTSEFERMSVHDGQ